MVIAGCPYQMTLLGWSSRGGGHGWPAAASSFPSTADTCAPAGPAPAKVQQSGDEPLQNMVGHFRVASLQFDGNTSMTCGPHWCHRMRPGRSTTPRMALACSAHA
jgi:hypothetical protein